MAGYTIPVTDSEKAVIRPSVIQILKTIREKLNMGRGCEFIYAGDTLSVPQAGTNLSRVNDSPLLASKEKLYVELVERPRTESISSTPVNERYYPNVLEDDTHKWRVRPVYGDMECTLNLTYRSSDKNTVQRWRDAFYTRLCMGAETMYCDVNYSFPIAEHILAFIKTFWETIDTELSFKEYLTSCIKRKYHFGTAFNGKWETLLFDEKKSGLLLLIPSKDTPEVERVQDGNGASTYTTTFTVEYIFTRPTGFNIQYPIWMNNQFINQKYYNNKLNRNTELTLPIKDSNQFNSDLLYFDQMKHSHVKTNYGYVLPEFDDWFIPDRGKVKKDRRLIFQILIGVDPDNPNLVLDLKSLPSMGLFLNPRMFGYFDRVGNLVFQDRGITRFELYNHNSKVNDFTLTLDKDYVITSELPLNAESGYYHLTFSIMTNLYIMPDNVTDDLIADGEFTKDIAEIVAPGSTDTPKLPDMPFPEPNEDGSLPKDGYVRWAYANANNALRKGGAGIGWTVNTIAIMTAGVQNG